MDSYLLVKSDAVCRAVGNSELLRSVDCFPLVRRIQRLFDCLDWKLQVHEVNEDKRWTGRDAEGEVLSLSDALVVKNIGSPGSAGALGLMERVSRLFHCLFQKL